MSQKKITKSEDVAVGSANNLGAALVQPLQRAAEERGHGPQTKASGVGGFIGGVVGSFAGFLGAVVGAAVGAGVGYLIADANEAERQA